MNIKIRNMTLPKRCTGGGPAIYISIRKAAVVKKSGEREGAEELVVELEDGSRAKALNYPGLTGRAEIGDRVLVNTTAVELSLGTGGWHFIYHIFKAGEKRSSGPGHIMKLRYTPHQFTCLTAEEDASPLHKALKDASSLEGRPVILLALHSMLAPVLAGIRAACKEKVETIYVMSDGAALPLPLSKTVAELKERGWLTHTVTAGHAFGGDYEAVNIYSGLLAAHQLCPSGYIIAGIGPGVVGTGTPFGHTGLQQGELLNAVSALAGRPICVPRISFADERERHRIVSHHTLTALGQVALVSGDLPLPQLAAGKMEAVERVLKEAGITGKHRVVSLRGEAGLALLKREGIEVKTMGRGPDEDLEFFLAAAAAGAWAVACKEN